QAALVVQVAVDDAAGAAVVVRGDAFGQAVRGVVPSLVAVVVRELQGADAVAGVVSAHHLAGQDGCGIAGRAARWGTAEATGAPGQVAGGVVAHQGGAGLGFVDAAQLLIAVVFVFADDRRRGRWRDGHADRLRR